MRLGVVMTGTGVHAAAAAGVMAELARRQIEPCAVCGIQAGAWPAALFAAGKDAPDLEQAVCQIGRAGDRLIPVSPRAALKKGRASLIDGKRLERLLVAQAGQNLLSLCPRPAVFLCRTARSAYPVVLTTRPYRHQPGTMLSMQASAAFAARAAMAVPPLLGAVEWMGSRLLPLADVSFGCGQLFALGADRVLVVTPHLAPSGDPDVLDLTGMMLEQRMETGRHIGVLHVQSPACVHALSLEKAPACAEAGRRAAESELDQIFERMGMAFCRVLPFRRIQH